MWPSCLGKIPAFHQEVVDRVIEGVRQSFTKEACEEVLELLKETWLLKLQMSSVVADEVYEHASYKLSDSSGEEPRPKKSKITRKLKLNTGKKIYHTRMRRLHEGLHGASFRLAKSMPDLDLNIPTFNIVPEPSSLSYLEDEHISVIQRSGRLNDSLSDLGSTSQIIFEKVKRSKRPSTSKSKFTGLPSFLANGRIGRRRKEWRFTSIQTKVGSAKKAISSKLEMNHNNFPEINLDPPVLYPKSTETQADQENGDRRQVLGIGTIKALELYSLTDIQKQNVNGAIPLDPADLNVTSASSQLNLLNAGKKQMTNTEGINDLGMSTKINLQDHASFAENMNSQDGMMCAVKSMAVPKQERLDLKISKQDFVCKRKSLELYIPYTDSSVQRQTKETESNGCRMNFKFCKFKDDFGIEFASTSDMKVNTKSELNLMNTSHVSTQTTDKDLNVYTQIRKEMHHHNDILTTSFHGKKKYMVETPKGRKKCRPVWRGRTNCQLKLIRKSISQLCEKYNENIKIKNTSIKNHISGLINREEYQPISSTPKAKLEQIVSQNTLREQYKNTITFENDFCTPTSSPRINHLSGVIEKQKSRSRSSPSVEIPLLKEHNQIDANTPKASKPKPYLMTKTQIKPQNILEQWENLPPIPYVRLYRIRNSSTSSTSYQSSLEHKPNYETESEEMVPQVSQNRKIRTNKIFNNTEDFKYVNITLPPKPGSPDDRSCCIKVPTWYREASKLPSILKPHIRKVSVLCTAAITAILQEHVINIIENTRQEGNVIQCDGPSCDGDTSDEDACKEFRFDEFKGLIGTPKKYETIKITLPPVPSSRTTERTCTIKVPTWFSKAYKFPSVLNPEIEKVSTLQIFAAQALLQKYLNEKVRKAKPERTTKQCNKIPGSFVSPRKRCKSDELNKVPEDTLVGLTYKPIIIQYETPKLNDPEHVKDADMALLYILGRSASKVGHCKTPPLLNAADVNNSMEISNQGTPNVLNTRGLPLCPLNFYTETLLKEPPNKSNASALELTSKLSNLESSNVSLPPVTKVGCPKAPSFNILETKTSSKGSPSKCAQFQISSKHKVGQRKTAVSQKGSSRYKSKTNKLDLAVGQNRRRYYTRSCTSVREPEGVCMLADVKDRRRYYTSSCTSVREPEGICIPQEHKEICVPKNSSVKAAASSSVDPYLPKRGSCEMVTSVEFNRNHVLESEKVFSVENYKDVIINIPPKPGTQVERACCVKVPSWFSEINTLLDILKPHIKKMCILGTATATAVLQQHINTIVHKASQHRSINQCDGSYSCDDGVSDVDGSFSSPKSHTLFHQLDTAVVPNMSSDSCITDVKFPNKKHGLDAALMHILQDSVMWKAYQEHNIIQCDGPTFNPTFNLRSQLRSAPVNAVKMKMEKSDIDSGDDLTDDEDPQKAFESDNIIYCQYELVSRRGNKRTITLKNGYGCLNGKDYIFKSLKGTVVF